MGTRLETAAKTQTIMEEKLALRSKRTYTGSRYVPLFYFCGRICPRPLCVSALVDPHQNMAQFTLAAYIPAHTIGFSYTQNNLLRKELLLCMSMHSCQCSKIRLPVQPNPHQLFERHLYT